MPLPFALIAVDDEHAWRAVEAAKVAGLSVPEDVSIIGVGNDDCLCESAQPTMSSLALDFEQVGYAAAAMLMKLMQGEPPAPAEPVAPLELVERGSTNVLAIDDPLVSDAVAMIRTQGDVVLTVDEVADRLHTSRRTLYRRFVAAMGRTPGEEIRRARLEAARRLIMNTDLKLVEVAVRTGFPSISQLSRDIEKACGQRPTTMRRRRRDGTRS